MLVFMDLLLKFDSCPLPHGMVSFSSFAPTTLC